MRELKRMIKRKLEQAPVGSESEKSPSAQPIAPAANDVLTADDKLPLLEALEATRWNKRAAAERLGLSYRQFRYRLQKHNIQ